MKKIKLLIMACALLGVGQAWADDVFKDVTSKSITNPSFENDNATVADKQSGDITTDWNYASQNNGRVAIFNSSSSVESYGKSDPSHGSYFMRIRAASKNVTGSQTIRKKSNFKLDKGSYRLSFDYKAAKATSEGLNFTISTKNGSSILGQKQNAIPQRTANSSHFSSIDWSTDNFSFSSNGTENILIEIVCQTRNVDAGQSILLLDNFIIERNLTQSLNDLLTEANAFYTAEGESYTALKSAIDEASAVTGSDNAEELEVQYNALTDALDLAKNHRKPWLAAWTTANTNYSNATYANVIGEEKTNLKTEIDKTEPSKADDYDSAKTALETANNAFTAAKTNYDKYAAESANATALGVSSVPALDVASNYSAKLKELIVLEDGAVTTGYTKDATKVIDAWNVASGVKNTWTLQNAGTGNNNHWSGETKSYYNTYKDEGFTMSASKAVSLPAGSYVLKAAARCYKVNQADQFYLGVTVDGNLTKEIYTSTGGGTGLGIDKTGAANYTEADDTYANSNNGYAWEWRFVPFVLTGTKEVQLKITANILEKGWVSFSDIQLLTTDDNTAVFEQIYNTAKASAESARDHANYENVSGVERTDLTGAIDAEVTSTIDGYSSQKDALDNAITTFIDAKANYDILATAISNANTIVTNSINVGDGVFQVPTTIRETLAEAQETAEATKNNTSTTSAIAATAATTLNDAISTYDTEFAAAELNAPAEGDVFNVMITTNDNYGFKDKPLTFNSDNVSGANFYKAYGVAPYRAQQITFTKVSGNQYTLSMINADGDRVYIRTNATSKGGNGNTSQIRLTTVPEYALAVQVIPSSTTNGVYTLKNTEANALLGCQDADSNPSGGIYTVASHNNFTITAASKPSVSINISQPILFATRIFPFTPELPSGVKAYSCAETVGDVLTLEEVTVPAANTPYILYAENGYSGDALTGYGTATADSYTTGLLTGVYTSTAAPVGSYVLQNNNDILAFYKVADGKQPAVGAYRAYLTVPNNNARALFFSFDDDNQTTAVKTIEALTSGKSEIYNTSGVRQNALQKGMNILKMEDGSIRKVMIK